MENKWFHRQLRLHQEENQETSNYVDGCCCISNNLDAVKEELRHRNGHSQDNLDQEYTETKCFNCLRQEGDWSKVGDSPLQSPVSVTTLSDNRVQPWSITLTLPNKCCQLKEQEQGRETTQFAASEPNHQSRNKNSQQQQHRRKRRQSAQKSLEIDRMLMDDLWERKPCPHCQWNDEQKGRRIDEFSRVVFPSMFTIFSISYWLYYSWYTQVNEA